MLTFKIDNEKAFMKNLLIETIFDDFLLVEANIKSGVNYHVSGRINKDFYDSEIFAELPSTEYVTWSTQKEHIYNVIKGKTLPLGFKIVLILSDEKTTNIVEKNNLPFSLDQILNLAINIYYDGSNINITSMASLKGFSMDKSLEIAWDNNVDLFFKYHKIAFEKI